MSVEPTESRVRAAVARATGRPAASAPVKRLAGHASLRSYWRVGERPGSLVVMVLPSDRKPEEATAGAPPPEEPFVDVQRYLKRIGLRVPEILAFEAAEGLMVLEDLGDDTLESVVLRAQAKPEPHYAQAVDALARLRAAAERAPDPSCVAFGRAFDEGLYLWELEHFVEWGLEAWKGRRLSPGEREVVDRHFLAIARRLAAEPLGFTHRDYQSRNLMVLPGGEQAVIDFQDALLAPRQYDLVALLRDSYVELPEDLVERMLRRWLGCFAEAGGTRLEEDPFRALFDILTVQRKLKDAGRFVYIDRVKKNPDFLRSIPASLRCVRRALARRPDLAELQQVLARHVPELAP
jgi:aminoglycoside/choline kinase family phosphotransferase